MSEGQGALPLSSPICIFEHAAAASGTTMMRGDPALVSDAPDMARRTYRRNRHGLFRAFAYSLVGIPLAAAVRVSRADQPASQTCHRPEPDYPV